MQGKLYKSVLVGMALCLHTLAFAQCEDVEAATRTVTELQSQASAATARKEAATKEFVQSLDRKVEQLGWTKEQKNRFLKDLLESGPYRTFMGELDQQRATIAQLLEEWDSPSVKGNPTRVCEVGLALGLHSRKHFETNDAMFAYILQAVEEAK